MKAAIQPIDQEVSSPDQHVAVRASTRPPSALNEDEPAELVLLGADDNQFSITVRFQWSGGKMRLYNLDCPLSRHHATTIDRLREAARRFLGRSPRRVGRPQLRPRARRGNLRDAYPQLRRDANADAVAKVANYIQLRDIAPDLPTVPVIQGWQHGDYLRCVDMFARSGIDLASEPVVGLGSVCRRQGTKEIAAIVKSLAAQRIRLHGFGVKTAGLGIYGRHLASADSLAWSYQGRYRPGCHSGHRTEANCARWAAEWRHKIIDSIGPEAIRRSPARSRRLGGAGRKGR
jgi:hypothetical protein